MAAVLAMFASTVLLSSVAQAQAFKSLPLDCGGWFSGFAQADNGRLTATATYSVLGAATTVATTGAT